MSSSSTCVVTDSVCVRQSCQLYTEHRLSSYLFWAHFYTYKMLGSRLFIIHFKYQGIVSLLLFEICVFLLSKKQNITGQIEKVWNFLIDLAVLGTHHWERFTKSRLKQSNSGCRCAWCSIQTDVLPSWNWSELLLQVCCTSSLSHPSG